LFGPSWAPKTQLKLSCGSMSVRLTWQAVNVGVVRMGFAIHVAVAGIQKEAVLARIGAWLAGPLIFANRTCGRWAAGLRNRMWFRGHSPLPVLAIINTPQQR
jgi:hypothetical protein